MFTLYDEDPLYFHPVSIEQPNQEGKMEPFTFEAGFRNIEQPRMKEIMRAVVEKGKAIREGDLSDDGVTDESICAEVLGGWRNVVDPSGNDVPFSDEARDKLLRKRGAATAITGAWFDSLNKKEEDRAGN